MKTTTFIENGSFFKGNLHTHTKISDGAVTAEEAKKLYKSKDYDFLAITDHNFYGIYQELSEKDFLILPGVEVDYAADNKNMHVVGIGIPGKNKFKHGQNLIEAKKDYKNIQDIINFLTKNGNHAIIAHPSWSNLSLSDIADAKDYLAMEIYNHICTIGYNNGDANVYFEHLCRNKLFSKCVATDDNHKYDEKSIGGFIMVKAESLTPENILTAMEKGSFYASSGPLIYDFYAKDRMVYISCSPSERVNFVSESVLYAHSFYDCGKNITECSAIMKDAGLVRAIVTDGIGRSAYTQPIKLY